MALEREDAVKKLREVMGATNPANAAEGTIRKLYAASIERIADPPRFRQLRKPRKSSSNISSALRNSLKSNPTGRDVILVKL